MLEFAIPLVTGLVIAFVSAALTIAVNGVQARRSGREQRQAERRRVILDLISEARTIAMMAPSTRAHLDAVAKATNAPAIWLGQLQRFDITQMISSYTEHWSRFERLGNQLLSTENEQVQVAVRRVAETTLAVMECHLSPTDRRRGLARYFQPAPSIDKSMTTRLVGEQQFAIVELASAVEDGKQAGVITAAASDQAR